MKSRIEFIGGPLDGSTTDTQPPPKVWEITISGERAFYDLTTRPPAGQLIYKFRRLAAVRRDP